MTEGAFDKSFRPVRLKSRGCPVPTDAFPTNRWSVQTGTARSCWDL